MLGMLAAHTAVFGELQLLGGVDFIAFGHVIDVLTHRAHHSQ